MSHITIRSAGTGTARVRVPMSKSVANRALILAAQCGGLEQVQGLPDAGDTQGLLLNLKERGQLMDCGDGGTTLRFLLAWAAVQRGEERLITGSQDLMKRPHAPLVKALCALGASISTTMSGYLVKGKELDRGELELQDAMSSQYLSALMLVAGSMKQGLRIRWTGKRLSTPYVQMTAKVMERFGIPAEIDAEGVYVPPAAPHSVDFEVPGDWSAAAFWFEWAALSAERELVLEGLELDGLQGDEACLRLWSPFVTATKRSGSLVVRANQAIDRSALHAFDLTETPDLFQPLAFTCAGLGVKAAFTGLDNLHLKESDRIAAVAGALKELGVEHDRSGSALRIGGPIGKKQPKPFDPRNDHRMAMALAPLAAVCESIRITDHEVVKKSYPGYWQDLTGAGWRTAL
ncbi:MAG: hypothetical protein KDB88_07125 [Flavobacteriales bacterium]|nr:hypothetical protein [Flavobacteriales bacterium]